MTNEAGGSWGEMDVLCKYLRDEMSAQKIGEIAEAVSVFRRKAQEERDEARAEVSKLRLAIKMASDAMATDPRDWSVDRTDAWVYALLLGWDRDAEEEIVQRHGAAFRGACSLGRCVLLERWLESYGPVENESPLDPGKGGEG